MILLPLNSNSDKFPTVSPILPLAFASLLLPLSAAEIELSVPGVAEPIIVSLPENHDPAKSWPAVLTYHGFNGRPNITSTREHTGPRDWIVVGMSYTQPGKYELAPEDIASELKVLHHVRDELARTQGLDPKRLYVTGYSKGGWMSDTIIQAEPSLKGAAILLGGHIPTPLKNPPELTKDTAIFIGVGRRDPNYLSSLKALVHYRGKGLTTTFEAWPKLGHEFPKNGSVGLREWFTIQNGGKPDEAALEKEFQQLLALTPTESWHALTAFKDRPFCTTADSTWPDKISAALKKLEADPQAAREAKILNAHRQLLGRELKMRTLDELKSIDASYMALAGASSGSPQEDDILFDHRRIEAVLKQANATPVPTPTAPKPLEPKLPKDERNIPGNPLVR